VKRRIMLDVIEKMSGANIGDRKMWGKMTRKIKSDTPLNPAELEYYTRLTRIYSNPAYTAQTVRGRNYHTRLSEHDDKPRCAECENDSEYYCNMNDQYFCQLHVAGHDSNE